MKIVDSATLSKTKTKLFYYLVTFKLGDNKVYGPCFDLLLTYDKSDFKYLLSFLSRPIYII